ncbi:MAG: hypothetical protein V4819_11225 [Verrucomicrobiota bacterium]
MNTPRLIIASSVAAFAFSGCNENEVKDLEIQAAKRDFRIESMEKEIARIHAEESLREKSVQQEAGASSSKIASLEGDLEKLKLELSETRSNMAAANNENSQLKDSIQSVHGLLEQIRSADQKSLEGLEARRVKNETIAAPIWEKIAAP